MHYLVPASSQHVRGDALALHEPAGAGAMSWRTSGLPAPLAAGQQAMTRLKVFLRSAAGHASLAYALTGKALTELSAADRALLARVVNDALLDRLPTIDWRWAGTLRTGAIDALANSVSGAFVGRLGGAGTVLLREGLSPAAQARTALEELGEALAHHAESIGLRTARGDDGERLAIVVQNGLAALKPRAELFVDRLTDRTVVMLDGRLTEAAAMMGEQQWDWMFDEIPREEDRIKAYEFYYGVKVDRNPDPMKIWKDAGTAIKKYFDAWAKDPKKTAEKTAIFLATLTGLGSVIDQSIRLKGNWNKLDGSGRADAILMIVTEGALMAAPGGAAGTRLAARAGALASRARGIMRRVDGIVKQQIDARVRTIPPATERALQQARKEALGLRAAAVLALKEVDASAPRAYKEKYAWEFENEFREPLSEAIRQADNYLFEIDLKLADLRNAVIQENAARVRATTSAFATYMRLHAPGLTRSVSIPVPPILLQGYSSRNLPLSTDIQNWGSAQRVTQARYWAERRRLDRATLIINRTTDRMKWVTRVGAPNMVASARQALAVLGRQQGVVRTQRAALAKLHAARQDKLEATRATLLAKPLPAILPKTVNSVVTRADGARAQVAIAGRQSTAAKTVTALNRTVAAARSRAKGALDAVNQQLRRLNEGYLGFLGRTRPTLNALVDKLTQAKTRLSAELRKLEGMAAKARATIARWPADAKAALRTLRKHWRQPSFTPYTRNGVTPDDLIRMANANPPLLMMPTTDRSRLGALGNWARQNPGLWDLLTGKRASTNPHEPGVAPGALSESDVQLAIDRRDINNPLYAHTTYVQAYKRFKSDIAQPNAHKSVRSVGFGLMKAMEHMWSLNKDSLCGISNKILEEWATKGVLCIAIDDRIAGAMVDFANSKVSVNFEKIKRESGPSALPESLTNVLFHELVHVVQGPIVNRRLPHGEGYVFEAVKRVSPTLGQGPLPFNLSALWNWMWQEAGAAAMSKFKPNSNPMAWSAWMARKEAQDFLNLVRLDLLARHGTQPITWGGRDVRHMSEQEFVCAVMRDPATRGLTTGQGATAQNISLEDLATTFALHPNDTPQWKSLEALLDYAKHSGSFPGL